MMLLWGEVLDKLGFASHADEPKARRNTSLASFPSIDNNLFIDLFQGLEFFILRPFFMNQRPFL